MRLYVLRSFDLIIDVQQMSIDMISIRSHNLVLVLILGMALVCGADILEEYVAIL